MVDPSEVQEWLEWAGYRLLSMNISSPAPRGPHTSWPSFAQDHNTAYGYTGERLRPARPRSQEIELMDKILVFPSVIKEARVRQIVNARALVTPISNRYLYSWSKIAVLLHTDTRRVKRLHQLGLLTISNSLTQEKIDAIRRLLPLLAN